MTDSKRYDCPGCGATMRLGGAWVELIDEDGHDVPECPGCYDGNDTWTFEPRVAANE